MKSRGFLSQRVATRRNTSMRLENRPVLLRASCRSQPVRSSFLRRGSAPMSAPAVPACGSGRRRRPRRPSPSSGGRVPASALTAGVQVRSSRTRLARNPVHRLPDRRPRLTVQYDEPWTSANGRRRTRRRVGPGRPGAGQPNDSGDPSRLPHRRERPQAVEPGAGRVTPKGGRPHRLAPGLRQIPARRQAPRKVRPHAQATGQPAGPQDAQLFQVPRAARRCFMAARPPLQLVLTRAIGDESWPPADGSLGREPKGMAVVRPPTLLAAAKPFGSPLGLSSGSEHDFLENALGPVDIHSEVRRAASQTKPM